MNKEDLLGIVRQTPEICLADPSITDTLNLDYRFFSDMLPSHRNRVSVTVVLSKYYADEIVNWFDRSLIPYTSTTVLFFTKYCKKYFDTWRPNTIIQFDGYTLIQCAKYLPDRFDEWWPCVAPYSIVTVKTIVRLINLLPDKATHIVKKFANHKFIYPFLSSITPKQLEQIQLLTGLIKTKA